MMLATNSIIVILVIGLIAGWLAGKIMGGGFGLIGDIIIGIIGAFIGSWLWGTLHLPVHRTLVAHRDRHRDRRRLHPLVHHPAGQTLAAQCAACERAEGATRPSRGRITITARLRHERAYLTAPPVMPAMKRSRKRL